MTMTPVVRIVGVLAAIAFAGQFGLAAAADEPKPKKEKAAKEAPATGQPGGGIQSNKAQAANSPRLTKGQSCAGDVPQIKKITPDEGKTGDKVTITGDHFGAPGCVSGVSFGPGGAAKFTQVDDTTITATVPAGNKGMEFLTVTGFTGSSTKLFLRK
jgi:hypothetical protein